MSDLEIVIHEGSLDADDRSRYAVATLLNETFDASGYDIHYCNGWDRLPRDARSAVIVVHGGHERGLERRVWQDAETLKSSIIIVIGDDESAFQTKQLLHPARKIWQQMAIPGVHNFANRFLICSYPKDAKLEIAKFERERQEKPLDWFFAGQVTHPRRHACVEALKRMDRGVIAASATFFGQAMADRADYYRHMAMAKICPCPAGPVTPCTIRMAEALECGAIPIVDEIPGARPGYPFGYFQNALGSFPFPVIRDWSTLPELAKDLLADFPRKQADCMEWWAKYKSGMIDWFREDVEEMKRRAGS